MSEKPTVKVMDDTCSDDECMHFVPVAPTQIVDVQTGRIQLKVGTFQADIDCTKTATGVGWVAVDGKRLKCRRFRVTYDVDHVPRIELDIYPLEAK